MEKFKPEIIKVKKTWDLTIELPGYTLAGSGLGYYKMEYGPNSKPDYWVTHLNTGLKMGLPSGLPLRKAQKFLLEIKDLADWASIQENDMKEKVFDTGISRKVNEIERSYH